MIKTRINMNLKDREEHVRKVLGGFLVLLLFWIIVATGIVPFKQYVEEVFIAIIIATILLAFTTGSNLAEKIAITSGYSMLLAIILYIALNVNWITGQQWNLYLQILVLLFLAGLTLSITVGARTIKPFKFELTPKSHTLKAIGSGLKFLALLLGFIWLFTIWHWITLFTLLMTPDQMLLLAIILYIIGGVLERGWHPVPYTAIERLTYGLAWSTLGMLILLAIFGFIGWARGPLWSQVKGQLLTVFILSFLAALSLSTLKPASVKEKERSFRTYVFEALKSASDEIIEKLGGLTVGSEVYVVTKNVPLFSLGKVELAFTPATIAVPIYMGTEEIGAVFFGKGRYVVDANVKMYQESFEGDTVLIGNSKRWKNAKKNANLVVARPEHLETWGFKTKYDVISTAEKRLNQVKLWKPRVPREREKKAEYTRIDLPGIYVEDMPERTIVKLPFIHIEEGPEGDFVKIGPLTIRDEKTGRTLVSFGPFKIVDDQAPKLIIGEDRWLVFIYDKTGREISIAAKEGKAVYTVGKTTLHVSDGKLRLIDGDIKVVMKLHKKSVSRNGFSLKVIKGESLRLVSGNLTLKAHKSGVIKLIDRYGNVHVIRDVNTALKVIEKADEMAEDLIRAILEKREVEGLAKFLEELDKEMKRERRLS